MMALGYYDKHTQMMHRRIRRVFLYVRVVKTTQEAPVLLFYRIQYVKSLKIQKDFKVVCHYISVTASHLAKLPIYCFCW